MTDDADARGPRPWPSAPFEALISQFATAVITSEIMKNERLSREPDVVARVRSMEPPSPAQFTRIVMEIKRWSAEVDASTQEVGAALPKLAVDAHGEVREPRWVARNKLLTTMLLVVLVIMASPHFDSLVPPEVKDFLAQEEGPAAFCLVLLGSVGAIMAVNDSKNKKH